MEVQFTFHTIAIAVIKLFILMFAGSVLYRFKFIDDKFTDMLSLLLVRLLFPSLIISKIITHFSFSAYAYWWMLPVAAIILSGLGIVIGAVICRFFKGFRSCKEFICACGFQNCGYLPMNLILFSFAGAAADRLLIFTFLFILGFNILVWSFVPLFLSGDLKNKLNARILLNPPVIATVFSILWVACFGTDSFPRILMDPMKQLGQAAFPVTMLTLGAYLYRYKAHNPRNKLPLASSLVVKLVLVPIIVLFIVKFIGLEADYKFFLFLQSIMPTAVSLVVIGSYTNADNKFFSSSIFYAHLIAIFSIPVWLVVFRMFVQ